MYIVAECVGSNQRQVVLFSSLSTGWRLAVHTALELGIVELCVTAIASPVLTERFFC